MKKIAKSVKKTLIKAMTAVAAILVSAASYAEEYKWTGTADADWYNPQNWADALVPGAGSIYFGQSTVEGRSLTLTNDVSVAGPVVFDIGSPAGGEGDQTMAIASAETPADEEDGESVYDGGLTASGALNIGVSGSETVSAVKFGRGSYSFGATQVGTADGVSGRLYLEDTDAFQVNGNLELRNGLVEGAGAGLNVSGRALVGVSNGGKTSVVKNGGDWMIDDRLCVGCAAGAAKAEFRQISGTTVVNGYITVGTKNDNDNTASENIFEISGGTVSAAMPRYPVIVGDLARPGAVNRMIVSGGTLVAADRVVIGNSTADGDLVVSNGLVSVEGDGVQFSLAATRAENRMNVLIGEGGVASVRKFFYNEGSDHLGRAVVTIDGGTVAAAASGDIFVASENMTVEVGAANGTIDTRGFDVSSSSSIRSAEGTRGGLRVTGGGTFTMSGAADYEGATVIELPTAIKVADAAAKDDVISGGLVVDIANASLPVGRFEILTVTGGETCSASDLARCSCDNPMVTFELSPDEKSICIVFPASAGAFVWTGSQPGSFSTASNWMVGGVVSDIAPTNGAEIVFMADADIESVCDYDLSVSRLVWAAGFGRVSVTNAASETLTVQSGAVFNYSDFTQELNLPVEYRDGDGYAAIASVGGPVTYWGGVKGTVPADGDLAGHYTLTATSWTIGSRITLADGTTVDAPAAAVTTTSAKLVCGGADTSFAVKSLSPRHSGDIFGAFGGDVSVSGLLSFTYAFGGAVGSGLAGNLSVGGIDVFNQNSVANTAAANRWYYVNNGGELVLGASGINDHNGRLIVGEAGKSKVIRSGAGGYTIQTSKRGNWALKSQHTEGVEVPANATLDIDATDAQIYIKNNNSKLDWRIRGAGAMSVFGAGDLAFQTTCQFTGGLTLSNGVNCTVAKGVRPGAGAVNVRDTAILRLGDSASGAAEVAGTLTLSGGSQIRIPELVAGVNPLAVNALAFEGVGEDGKVLVYVQQKKAGGELKKGAYQIMASATDLPENAGENFTVAFADSVVWPKDEPVSVVAHNRKLYLVIGPSAGIWIGDAAEDDTLFSNRFNWLDNTVPSAGDTLNFMLVTSAKTLQADIENGPRYATLDFGGGVVTFDGNLSVESITNASRLAVSAGSTLFVSGDVVLDGEGTVCRRYVCSRNDGTIRIGGQVVACNGASGQFSEQASAGVFFVKGMTFRETADDVIMLNAGGSGSDIEIVVGEDGLVNEHATANGFYLGLKTGGVTLDAGADFAINSRLGVRDRLTIVTSDYETEEPRTVTFNGAIEKPDGSVTVAGRGTVVINADCSTTSPFLVKDTAALALNAGRTISAAPVTVSSGATFAAPQADAGTATLGRALTLESGASIAVSNIVDGTTAIAVASVSLPEEGQVSLVVTGDGRLTNGLYRILASTADLPSDIVSRFTVEASAVASEASLIALGANGRTGALKELYLVAGPRSALPANVWIGQGADDRFTTGDNWLNGLAPVADVALDFTRVASAATATADLDDVSFPGLVSGSSVVTFSGSLTVGSCSDSSKIAVGADSRVTVDGEMTLEGGGTAVLVDSVAEGGVFAVGSVTATDTSVTATARAGEGFVSVGGILLGGDREPYLYLTPNMMSTRWIVGEGGISGTGAWGYSDGANSAYIYPDASDFTIAAPTVIRSNFGHYELNTTGKGDGEGHVITLAETLADNGRLFIGGSGAVVCDYVAEAFGGKSAYSGAVSVGDTATLVLNPGSLMGSGAVTLASGTTLSVPGAATLGGDLRLAGGSTFAFSNLTADAAAPLTVKSVSATGDEKVRIVVDGDKELATGFYKLAAWTNTKAAAPSVDAFEIVRSGAIAEDASTLLLKVENRTLILQVGVPTAKVGGTIYESVAEAKQYASADEPATLIRSGVAETVEIAADETLYFDEGGYRFLGKFDGEGRVVMTSAPYAATTSKGSGAAEAGPIVADSWTGTFVVGWAATGKFLVNNLGNENSTVEFAGGSTASPDFYFRETASHDPADAKPAIVLSSALNFAQGFTGSSKIYKLSKVTGVTGGTLHFYDGSSSSKSVNVSIGSVVEGGQWLRFGAYTYVTIGEVVVAEKPASGAYVSKVTGGKTARVYGADGTENIVLRVEGSDEELYCHWEYNGAQGGGLYMNAYDSGDHWPADWNDGQRPGQEILDRFEEWYAKGQDVTAEGAEAAFLLGLDSTAGDKSLDTTAIDVIDGETKTVTVTVNQDLSKANGYVYVKYGSSLDLAATKLAAIGGEIDADDGRVVRGLAASESVELFQIAVGYDEAMK